MKKRFLTISLLATSLATTCIGGVSAFAQETGTVNVEYSTQTLVNGTEYAVAIPAKIAFKNDIRTQEANLKLTNPNGTEYTGSEVTVEGKVASKNGYKLTLQDGSDPIAYTLRYGSTTMQSNNSAQVIGNLTKNDPTLLGTANLPEASQAAKSGNHTDVLTYTFTKK